MLHRTRFLKERSGRGASLIEILVSTVILVTCFTAFQHLQKEATAVVSDSSVISGNAAYEALFRGQIRNAVRARFEHIFKPFVEAAHYDLGCHPATTPPADFETCIATKLQDYQTERCAVPAGTYRGQGWRTGTFKYSAGNAGGGSFYEQTRKANEPWEWRANEPSGVRFGTPRSLQANDAFYLGDYALYLRGILRPRPKPGSFEEYALDYAGACAEYYASTMLMNGLNLNSDVTATMHSCYMLQRHSGRSWSNITGGIFGVDNLDPLIFGDVELEFVNMTTNETIDCADLFTTSNVGMRAKYMMIWPSTEKMTSWRGNNTGQEKNYPNGLTGKSGTMLLPAPPREEG